MHPQLAAYAITFASKWNRDVFIMQQADVLRLCPAGYCGFCNKFLLPWHAHRFGFTTGYSFTFSGCLLQGANFDPFNFPYGPLVIIFGIYARKGCTKWGTVLRGLLEDPSPTIQFFGVSPPSPTPQKKKEFVSRREPNHRLSAKHRKLGNHTLPSMRLKAFWNLRNSHVMSILPWIEDRS